MKYVAFMRGLNVGGHQVKMTDLKSLFESIGFQNVKTLLASGNVIFETDSSNIQSRIEESFQKKYGYESRTIIRSIAEIERLIKLDPFKDINVTKNTRLYITFLNHRSDSPDYVHAGRHGVKTPSGKNFKIPYTSPDGTFKILHLSDSELSSTLELKDGKGTVDYMSVIEKEFGKDVTTRNWNTILRIMKAVS